MSRIFEEFFNMGGQQERKPKKDVDTSSYYKLLGVEKNASIDDIKKAYKTLVVTKHPDKGGDPQEVYR